MNFTEKYKIQIRHLFQAYNTRIQFISKHQVKKEPEGEIYLLLAKTD